MTSMKTPFALLLVGCAHATVGFEAEDDTGPALIKEAGAADIYVKDTYVPPAQDVDVPSMDSGSVTQDAGWNCAMCDLANASACQGSVCGWDPNMMSSKCGYTLGQGQQNAPCNGNAPCGPGYVCVTPANKCMHWCQKPTGAGCPQGTQCTVNLQNPPVICGVTYAVCQ